MGEIAEMMLDGTLCCQCGEFLDSDLGDFPQMCAGCADEGEPMVEARPTKKVECPHCKKRFSGQASRDQHIRMKRANGDKAHAKMEAS